MDERDGCHNCGARTSKGLCNNYRSPNYKCVGTTRCSVWIPKVFTPPEWEKMR
jgi:hypothetical protein